VSPLCADHGSVLQVACTRVHACARRHTDKTLRAAVKLWFDDNAAAVARYGPIGDWDTRDVKSMRELFYKRADFDEDIGRWNVGSVEDMYSMFQSAAKFNRPLDKWDVSSVKNVSHMFAFAAAFNQPLDKWDVSSVKDMSCMFYRAASFNQPLDKWDVSSGKDMSSMFYGAASFKQPATLKHFGLVLPSPSARTRTRTPSDRIGSLERTRQHRRAHICSARTHALQCCITRAHADCITRAFHYAPFRRSSARGSQRNRARAAFARVVCGSRQR
jgi:hypothetical protein